MTTIATQKAWKGFLLQPDGTLRCRDKTYTEGEAYTEDRADLCLAGMHACLEPRDVLRYYGPGGNVSGSDVVWHEVDVAADAAPNPDSDSKVASTFLRVGGQVTIFGLLKANAEVTWSRVAKARVAVKAEAARAQAGEPASSGDYSTAASSGDSSTSASSGTRSTSASSGYSSTSASSGDYSTSASSGTRSTAASSGDYSTSASSGDCSTSASSGTRSTAASSGDSSTSASSGYYSTAASSGTRSTAASSGTRSTSASSGYSSTSASSGDYSTSIVEGEESVAVAAGSGCRAAGAETCWLVLTERDDEGRIVDLVSVKVGRKKRGARVKPGRFYELRNGQVVEVTADGEAVA